MTGVRASSIRSRKPRTAVVVIHGMGEQVPMRTLRDFVHAVWTTDHSLIRRERPDSNTGGQRTDNPSWSKPDARNRSYELRRITTESADSGRRTDFFEFYWAHLMHGTTWEHVKSWLLRLLLRSPRRVPDNVFSAWVLLWILTLGVVAALVYSLLPGDELRQCLAGSCDSPRCDARALCWSWVWPLLLGLGSILFGAFVNVVLLKYFGDVARYVSAEPLNVARRQEIREKGVELLETLMGIRTAPGAASSAAPAADYDRIVLVAHSLGSVIAYDILKHCFARVNRSLKLDPTAGQPARDAMEKLLREATEKGLGIDIDSFQQHQAGCREELLAAGSPWIVSDFVTLGSPLTHAEFLLAEDEADLHRQQQERILPTCPPMLEWDGTTKRRHFTYWPGKRRTGDDDAEAALTRIPHHAAHFAYTRWTNLYSPAKRIFWGDLVSGPLATHFAAPSTGGARVEGIRDLPVLTGRERPPFFAHTKYWDFGDAAVDDPPPHILALRKALDLGSG